MPEVSWKGTCLGPQTWQLVYDLSWDQEDFFHIFPGLSVLEGGSWVHPQAFRSALPSGDELALYLVSLAQLS